MEYTLVVIVVVVLLAITSRISYRVGLKKLKLRPADVTVILGSSGGVVTIDVNPPQALLYCEQDAVWAISNSTDKAATVDLTDFKDILDGPKDPIVFQVKPITIPPGETRKIKGKVKDRNMFQVNPKGKKDAIGEYQDFKYSVKADGQTLDPEVRIRQ